MIAHAAALPAGHAGSRRWGRSVAAVFLGILAVFVLSLGTDQVLHLLAVYPPWGVPMYDTSLNLLALGYRVIFGVAGGALTARLAPVAPIRHALIMGAVGLGLSILGVIAGATMKMGPLWYPIALAVSAVPCAWTGGALWIKLATGRLP